MNVATKAWCGDCRATQVFEHTDGAESVCTVCGGGWVDLVMFEAVLPSTVRVVA